jgi:hypothetical protein
MRLFMDATTRNGHRRRQVERVSIFHLYGVGVANCIGGQSSGPHALPFLTGAIAPGMTKKERSQQEARRRDVLLRVILQGTTAAFEAVLLAIGDDPSLTTIRSDIGDSLMGMACAHAKDKSAEERARLLLARGLNANERGVHGRMPLHVAMANGNHNTARVLLGHGADVNAVDANGFTALHMAALSGSVEMLRWLLEAGANVEGGIAGGAGHFTPLHAGACSRSPEVSRSQSKISRFWFLHSMHGFFILFFVLAKVTPSYHRYLPPISICREP